MKKFILYTLSIITLITITFPASSSANGFNLSQDCQGAASSAVCSSSTNNSSQNPISLKIADIVNILIEFAGALAIIVIIISGIRYSLASGDSNKTNSAKNGLIYTAVGLVVIVAAKIIIDVVIGNLKK